MIRFEEIKKETPYDELTTLQKRCMIAAIAVAFGGIFVWFFKILFF